MKKLKKIEAATYEDIDLEYAFDWFIAKANTVGYGMTVDSDTDGISIYLQCQKDQQFMPKILVGAFEGQANDGSIFYYFEPNITFPEMHWEDMEYHDSLSYWVGRWKNVAEFVEELGEFRLVPDDLVDIE